MDDEQRYLFDLQGYLVIPGAIGPDLLARLNPSIDAGIAAETAQDMRTHRFGDLLGRDPAFLELIDNPAVIDVLIDVLGTDFRLDHTYADVIRAGDGPIGTVLHGGAVPFRPAEYYTTVDGTAKAGSDYVGATGTGTFAPGQRNKTISVQIKGDKLKEKNESFIVTLYDPSNGTITDPNGSGVIRNND